MDCRPIRIPHRATEERTNRSQRRQKQRKSNRFGFRPPWSTPVLAARRPIAEAGNSIVRQVIRKTGMLLLKSAPSCTPMPTSKNAHCSLNWNFPRIGRCLWQSRARWLKIAPSLTLLPQNICRCHRGRRLKCAAAPTPRRWHADRLLHAQCHAAALLSARLVGPAEAATAMF